MAMASLARRRATEAVLLRRPHAAAWASACRGYAASGEESDVVVIGGGPGGYVAAIKAAQLGLKTTCIEKRGALGGTCLNVGCIPSKALLHSSHMYHEAKSSFAHHGVKFSNLEVDLPAMMSQKDKAVAGLTKGIEGLFKKNKVEYVKGFGKLVSPSEVSVDLVDGGSTIVKGKNIIVATGSDVKSLPGVTIDEKKIVSSTGALALTEIPKKLVVIGAGYIGLEMGSVWNRLGSEVTVVEFAPDIVPSMDGEIRKQFQRMLEKQKFKFMLKTKVVGVDSSGSGVKLTVEPAAGGEQTVIEADIVLVSAGRVPYTAGIGLDTIGVETDKGGRVLVDKRFMTNVKGVYAIGDAIPGPMLAHKAEEDGVACVEFIAGKEGHVDYDTVPGVVYTHPEVASVGKTEEHHVTISSTCVVQLASTCRRKPPRRATRSFFSTPPRSYLFFFPKVSPQILLPSRHEKQRKTLLHPVKKIQATSNSGVLSSPAASLRSRTGKKAPLPLNCIIKRMPRFDWWFGIDLNEPANEEEGTGFHDDGAGTSAGPSAIGVCVCQVLLTKF